MGFGGLGDTGGHPAENRPLPGCQPPRKPQIPIGSLQWQCGADPPRMLGQGCQPWGFCMLLGSLESRRLSRLVPDHPKTGGKEAPDSQPCFGSRNLPLIGRS